MKTYLYKVIGHSDKRGYNRTITAYSMKNNVPTYIGENEEINTASYSGDKSTACKLIAEIEGYKFKGYSFTRKDIKVYEV